MLSSKTERPTDICTLHEGNTLRGGVSGLGFETDGHWPGGE